MIRWGNVNGGVVKVLRGATLPCGCIAGIYETYAGATVAIIDEACADCRVSHHRNGRPVDVGVETDREPGEWAT